MEQQAPPGIKGTRVHRSANEIRQLLDFQRQSKLTVKAWCKANGIRENNFYRWVRKYRRKPVKRRGKTKGAAVNGFARIQINSGSSLPSAPLLFAEIGQLRLYKEVPATYLKALLS